MDAIPSLMQVLDRLLGPLGCPWDQKQTLASSRTYLLEESAEVIEAIDLQNAENIQEELGDLLFIVLFLCRLAEKEGKASLEQAATLVKEKLIRRHPHVFGHVQSLTPEQVAEQWQEIKKTEKKAEKHPLDKIPKTLPALSYAAEVIKFLQKHHIPLSQEKENDLELQMGRELLALVQKSQKLGIDPELALRRTLNLMKEQLTNLKNS